MAKKSKESSTSSSNGVKKGDKLKVDYEGRFESGEVFDSSVLGMKVGESKEFKINAKEAYGESNPQLIREIPRNVLPQDQEPKVGMMLIMNAGDKQMPVRISEVSKDTIKIDLNHPLAGKNLIFKITLVSIN